MVSGGFVFALAAVVLVGFAAVGIRHTSGRIGSVEDFISARNSAGGTTLTATILASGMGAWILFSPAEAGAAFGGITAVVGYAIGSALPLLGYAVIGPRIRGLIPEGHSLTEYAYARYGAAMYAYVLVVSVMYMFVFLAAELTGIASALALVAGVPGWQTAGLVGLTVFAYTAYGGLQASMFTDLLQTALILPLLVVAVAATLLALGGPVGAFEPVAETRPELLRIGFLPGVRFGVYTAVALLGAEMLNQAWWQRVYAARNDATLRRSFVLAAVGVFGMVFVVGLFGPLAAGRGLVSGPSDASVSLFLVVNRTLSEPLVVVVALLALLLVVSSADTIFNAIASVVTADLPRLIDADDATLTTAARAFTGIVALAATYVGAQGYSVLTLFFLADLLAAATFVPLYHGLYSERASAGGALAGSSLALVVGLGLFPPARGVLAAVGLADALPAASYFRSFLSAAGISAVVSFGAARLRDREYDLGRLSREIRRLNTDEGEPGIADGGSEGERPQRR